MKAPSFNIVPVGVDVVRALCKEHHTYGSVGKIAVYAFAVIEDNKPVAAFAWLPPAPGAARAICPEAPESVLGLSRMIAVPHSSRRLQHISKPLRYQMRQLIDRTRWPVLVTYSDDGQGHTGHVYKCSGWQPIERAQRRFFLDDEGRRVSSYSNGKSGSRSLRFGGMTTLLRWEHWACERGHAAKWMNAHGWHRVAIEGRFWRSGNPAFTWKRLIQDTSV